MGFAEGKAVVGRVFSRVKCTLFVLVGANLQSKKTCNRVKYPFYSSLTPCVAPCIVRITTFAGENAFLTLFSSPAVMS